MRFLLKALVIGDLENSLERVAARLDDDQTVNMASDDVCAEVIDSLMPSSLIGFLAALALGSHVDVPQPEERPFEGSTLYFHSSETHSAPVATEGYEQEGIEDTDEQIQQTESVIRCGGRATGFHIPFPVTISTFETSISDHVCPVCALISI